MATAAKNDNSDEAYVQRMRRELAAAYRLVALFGWDDHIATHLSVRLPVVARRTCLNTAGCPSTHAQRCRRASDAKSPSLPEP